MTIKQWLLVTVPMAIIVIGLLVLVLLPRNEPAQKPPESSQNLSYATIDNLIAVDAPFKNATISSPLVISGTARGTWYFEASAPIELRDASGAVIVRSYVEAQSDWMTEDFVPFKATLTFPKQPAGSIGTLVLQNDNPSGDPERQKELLIPVKF